MALPDGLVFAVWPLGQFSKAMYGTFLRVFPTGDADHADVAVLACIVMFLPLAERDDRNV
jgi:hypothetical protein